MKRNLAEISNDLNRQSGYEQLPGLIFITDRHAQPSPEEVIGKLPAGSMVILRDYGYEGRRELGEALHYISKARNIKFLVAGDLTLALNLGADGIHLPEYMMKEAAKIRKEHPALFITAATHDEIAVMTAVNMELNAVLLGPVFPTKSHPETINDASLTVGISRLAAICKKCNIAIYALGGINEKTARLLFDTGVAGIAATRGL